MCVIWDFEIIQKSWYQIKSSGQSIWVIISRAGGYKNGVGGRVVGFLHLGACVSMEGISLNSSQSIGEKRWAIISNWSDSFEEIEWFLYRHRMNIKCVVSPSFSNLFHQKRHQKITLLCDATSAASRPTALPTGPRGAVRQPNQNGNAQRNQTHTLHFCKATAKPNF